ncbi:MAG: amidohydrolase [Firmicutes bacterium]|nr:amidohydrolase [Bacillota bacterium]
MIKAFTGGRIFTSCPDKPFVDSILVEDGVIVCAGERSELPPGKYEEEDLAGRTVIPGFVDAHMHPLMLADYSEQIACLPPEVNSIEDLKDRIAEEAARTEEGGWILGWGYDEGKFAEGRSPNRYDLDRGSSRHPVFIVRSCEHIRCVNSRALEIAGIDRNTPDPPGGTIEKDENGEPTGILKENARDLVLPYMPEAGREDRTEQILKLGELLTSQGIVGIADMGNLHEGENYSLFREAEARGFRQRVAVYYMWDYFMDDESFTMEKELMDGSLQIHKAGIKLIGDGSISGRTAWVGEPYLDGSEGLPVYSDESMEKAIDFARKTGCQIAVHAMGGRAIDRAVRRLAEEECGLRVRLEHLTEPSEEAVETTVRKGFAFVSQPIFKYCEIETYLKNLGRDRLKAMYPYRTMLERGVKLALSTDAPATSWAVPSDPFANLKAAVTGRAWDGSDMGRDERLDIETAIRLYTAEAAEVCGFTGLGRIAPGYSASFAVLSDDIFGVDPERIDEIRVERTYIDGERVY